MGSTSAQWAAPCVGVEGGESEVALKGRNRDGAHGAHGAQGFLPGPHGQV